MRFSALLLVGLLALGFHNGQAASAADGFEPIFDGRTLEGWQGQDMSFFSVEDGSIVFLRQDGRVRAVGYHVFAQPCQPELWAEVLEGEGYRFHAPCAPPTGVLPEKVLGEVEAKPKGAKEPKLKDALYSLEQFLNGKPEVLVYGWPGKPRPKRQDRACQREEDFNQEEDWDE